MSGSLQGGRVALIAGVSGAVGTALARELAGHDEWQVIGLSRRKPGAALDGVRYIEADMAQPEALARVADSFSTVTHLFYCARISHREQMIEDAPGNLALLRNVTEAVEARSHALAHVHIVQGGKYYGVHVGPFPTPARETDPRAPIENFNYAHQDYLMERVVQAPWTWTASRPNTLLHFSPDNARNLVSTLGAYASLCRELGASLDFPGPQGAYTSATQVTTLTLLARAIAWMATEPGCANQAFNVTNTDIFRWEQLWPRLADAFGVPPGGVRPMRLGQVMPPHEDVWAALAEREGLKHKAIDAVANWGFADATLERYWDEILSHNHIRSRGFHGWDDSVERFFELIASYRVAALLPGERRR